MISAKAIIPCFLKTTYLINILLSLNETSLIKQYAYLKKKSISFGFRPSHPASISRLLSIS